MYASAVEKPRVKSNYVRVEAAGLFKIAVKQVRKVVVSTLRA